MDRIVYVAAGRVAVGRTDEVVQPEVLSRLYGQHVDVIRVHDRILVVAGRTDEAVAEHEPISAVDHDRAGTVPDPDGATPDQLGTAREPSGAALGSA